MNIDIPTLAQKKNALFPLNLPYEPKSDSAFVAQLARWYLESGRHKMDSVTINRWTNPTLQKVMGGKSPSYFLGHLLALKSGESVTVPHSTIPHPVHSEHAKKEEVQVSFRRERDSKATSPLHFMSGGKRYVVSTSKDVEGLHVSDGRVMSGEHVLATIKGYTAGTHGGRAFQISSKSHRYSDEGISRNQKTMELILSWLEGAEKERPESASLAEIAECHCFQDSRFGVVNINMSKTGPTASIHTSALVLDRVDKVVHVLDPHKVFEGSLDLDPQIIGSHIADLSSGWTVEPSPVLSPGLRGTTTDDMCPLWASFMVVLLVSSPGLDLSRLLSQVANPILSAYEFLFYLDEVLDEDNVAPDMGFPLNLGGPMRIFERVPGITFQDWKGESCDVYRVGVPGAPGIISVCYLYGSTFIALGSYPSTTEADLRVSTLISSLGYIGSMQISGIETSTFPVDSRKDLVVGDAPDKEFLLHPMPHHMFSLLWEESTGELVWPLGDPDSGNQFFRFLFENRRESFGALVQASSEVLVPRFSYRKLAADIWAVWQAHQDEEVRPFVEALNDNVAWWVENRIITSSLARESDKYLSALSRYVKE